MVLVYDPLADKFDRDVFSANIAQQYCIELDKYSTCNTSFADCLGKETTNNEERKRKITYRRKGKSDFPLTLARWPMASEHCRWTSDFLSYLPRLASGISKIVEK